MREAIFALGVLATQEAHQRYVFDLRVRASGPQKRSVAGSSRSRPSIGMRYVISRRPIWYSCHTR